MVVEELFSVIAERTRRDILDALATEHKAVGQLVEELGVSQPTVSKHLRVLREAGVVTMRAQGQKRFYSINTEPLSLVSDWLEGLGAGSTRPAGNATAATAAAAMVTAPETVAPATAARPPAATHPRHLVSSGVPSAAERDTIAPAAAAAAAATATAPATAATAPATLSPAAAAPAPAKISAPRQPGAVDLHGVANENTGHEASVQQQITRSVGRAANKAADLLANLPTFRRRKD